MDSNSDPLVVMSGTDAPWHTVWVQLLEWYCVRRNRSHTGSPRLPILTIIMCYAPVNDANLAKAKGCTNDQEIRSRQKVVRVYLKRRSCGEAEAPHARVGSQRGWGYNVELQGASDLCIYHNITGDDHALIIWNIR